MSYFKEQLNKAKANNLIIIDLDIANELETCCEQELSDKQFDEACSLIKEAWMRSDNITVWSFVKALLEMTNNNIENFNLHQISPYDLIDKASYYI
jgi:hypothetical protein